MALDERAEPNYITVSEVSRIDNSFNIVIKNTGDAPHVFKNDGTITKIPGIDSGETGEHLSRIYFYFPLCLNEKDPPSEKRKYLTTVKLAESIYLNVSAGWSYEQREHDEYGYYWIAYPLANTSLDAGRDLLIRVNGLSTYLYADRLSFTAIRYDDGALRNEIAIALRPPPLEITGFRAEASQIVGYGDYVCLKWECRGAARCFITPFDITVDAVSEQLFPVYGETVFMLYAQKGDRIVSKSVTVTPTDGGSSPSVSKSSVSYGESVTLSPALTGTRHAWVDNGVGRVSGDIEVVPQKPNTIYTVRTEHAGGVLEQSVSVTVTGRLSLLYFSAFKVEGGKHRVVWGVANAESTRLSCGGAVLSESTEGSIDFVLSANELSLVCTGINGQQLNEKLNIGG